MVQASEIKELLQKKNLTIGSVESFTGGKFASAITSVPGASNVFKGALVTYWNEIKENVLNINPNIINKYGACSKEVGYEMAEKGRKILNVDICVSFTGNAGPLPMENKPVGEVFIGINYNDNIEVFKYNLDGDRSVIQTKAIELAFEEIKKKIS